MAKEWFYIIPAEETVEKGGKGSGWFAPPKGTHIEGSILSPEMSKQGRANAIRNLTIPQYFALLRTGLPKPKNPKHASYERSLFRSRADELRRMAKKDARSRQIWNEEAVKLGGERGQRMKIS